MSKSLKITKTAIMLALLIVLQTLTRGLGQYVTGSLVNCILFMSCYFVGTWGSVVIAIISPFLAFMLGIGPMYLPIVPCIAIANLILVLTCIACFRISSNRYISYLGVALSAVLKAFALYILVVKLLLPNLGLPQNKLTVLSIMFSWPQLVTAFLGGIVSLIVKPLIAKGITK